MELGAIAGDTGLPSSNNNCIRTKDFIEIQPNTQYTIKNDKDYGNYIYYYDSNQAYLGKSESGNNPRTITTLENAKYLKLRTVASSVQNDLTTKFMLALGSTALDYVPYASQTLPLNLGTLELNKIGTYQDYIYKNNDKWYKHEEIGKVVLNGSEDWSDFSVGDTNFRCQYDVAVPNILTPPTNPAQLLSNYFKAINRDNAYAKTEIGVAQYGSTLGKVFFCAPNTILSSQTLVSWKTWLSTHNTIVYYILAIPNDIQITDTTLISQLEEIDKMQSYNGTTIITSTYDSNNAQMILQVSSLKGE